MVYELQKQGLKLQTQVCVPIAYDQFLIENGLRLDMLVEDCVIVELKAVETVLPVHEAQVLTYLKLSGNRVGLLINFNVPRIKQGIKRLIV